MVEEGKYLEHTTHHSGVSSLQVTHLGVFVVRDVTYRSAVFCYSHIKA